MKRVTFPELELPALGKILMVSAGCLLFAPYGAVDQMVKNTVRTATQYQESMDRSPLHQICAKCDNPATHKQFYQGLGTAKSGTFYFCDRHWPPPSSAGYLPVKHPGDASITRFIATTLCVVGYGFSLLLQLASAYGGTNSREKENARLLLSGSTFAIAVMLWVLPAAGLL